MEAKAEKVRVAETEERKKKERSRKETVRTGGKTRKGREKTKERKKNGGKKSDRRMEDLGWRRRNSEVRRRSRKTSPRKIP